jgi:hypothetical protein
MVTIERPWVIIERPWTFIGPSMVTIERPAGTLRPSTGIL